tara:strand:+ start:172 stop:411 length:240 start_codon:yes stop_codon:yes gene_type:complete
MTEQTKITIIQSIMVLTIATSITLLWFIPPKFNEGKWAEQPNNPSGLSRQEKDRYMEYLRAISSTNAIYKVPLIGSGIR